MPWIEVDQWYEEGRPATEKETAEVFRYSKLKKTKAKFYADEDFPSMAVELLRFLHLDVLTATEAKMAGRADEHHVAYARRRHRIILTRDRDFLDLQRFPLIQSPTIVVCDLGPGADSGIWSALYPILRTSRFPQFYETQARMHTHPNGEWRERMKCLNGEELNDRFRLFKGRVQVWKPDHRG